MRIIAFLAAAGASVLLIAAAPSPEEAWKASIAEQNRDYAQTPHAMLKIQDSAYLAEGATAILTGHKGNPGSYRWTEDPHAPVMLRVTLKHGTIAAARNGISFGADALMRGLSVDANVDLAGEPTQIGAGVQGWRIFVFNQQNPAAKTFKGVSYFPYDPEFRVKARFVPDARRPARVFRTSRGTDKQFYHMGDAHFSLEGKAVTLPLYAAVNDPRRVSAMTAFFTDDLTGKGAYGAGRYVEVDNFGKFPPANLTIDFNFAYNPNCARSAHFTCPIAMDTIPLAIKVGERDPHLSH